MMAIPVARSAVRGWPRLPRRTARLRLTALYGALFLACGAILLAVSYLLTEQAIAPGRQVNEAGFSQVQIPAASSRSTGAAKLSPPAQVSSLMLTLGKQITTSDLRQVLIDAPIALAIVSCIHRMYSSRCGRRAPSGSRPRSAHQVR